MDLSVYHALNDFAFEHSAVGDLAKFFAKYAVFVLVAGFAALWLVRGRHADPRREHAIFASGAALVLALIVVQIVNHIWDRQRPFVTHPYTSHLLIAHGRDASFPSDHTSGAFAIVFALLFLGKRRLSLIAAVVATLIGVARVMVGVHYPTDVLGGVGVGALAALIVCLPAPRALLARLSGWCSRVYERLLPDRFAPALASAAPRGRPTGTAPAFGADGRAAVDPAVDGFPSADGPPAAVARPPRAGERG